jgi:methylated-DNA-protein-cysteine methyltransferase related protein
VAEVLAALAPGDVVSYGEVAAEAGSPGAARAVGTLLSRGFPDHDLPWWRVVRSDGSITRAGGAEQQRRLRAEGVEVVDGRVVQFRRSRRGGRSR